MYLYVRIFSNIYLPNKVSTGQSLIAPLYSCRGPITTRPMKQKMGLQSINGDILLTDIYKNYNEIEAWVRVPVKWKNGLRYIWNKCTMHTITTPKTEYIHTAQETNNVFNKRSSSKNNQYYVKRVTTISIKKNNRTLYLKVLIAASNFLTIYFRNWWCCCKGVMLCWGGCYF